MQPWRAVKESEPMPGWWNGLGVRRNWFLTTECGHHLVRRGARAPKHVRCEGCL